MTEDKIFNELKQHAKTPLDLGFARFAAEVLALLAQKEPARSCESTGRDSQSKPNVEGHI